MDDTRRAKILAYIDDAIAPDQTKPIVITHIPVSDVQDALDVLWDVSKPPSS